MLIKWELIHDTQEIAHYGLKDEIYFGKHRGHTIKYLIAQHQEYIDWMISTQDGFGLSAAALSYYVAKWGSSRGYPDHKLELTDVQLIQVPTEWHIVDKPNKQKHFNINLGVNAMKRAILVSHNNTYQPDDFFPDNDGEEFPYLTNIKDLKEGDYVVVDCSNGLQVCRVTKLIGLTPHQTGKAFKWIVTKVDLEQHEKNKLAQEKIQEIQNRVRVRKEQLEGQLILKQLAQEDPDMRDLLLELGALDKSLVPASILDAPKKEEEIL